MSYIASSRLPRFWITLALCALVSIPVAAQQNAGELVEEAREHFVEGRYIEAVELFEQAFALDPHPIILYNQARCYEELRDLPRALTYFRRALTLDPSPGVEEELLAKSEELENLLIERGFELTNVDRDDFVFLSSLSITSLPSGGSVALDGVDIGLTPIDDLYIAPDSYRITVQLEGYTDHTRTIVIDANRSISVHAGLRPNDGPGNVYIPPDPGMVELSGPRRGMAVYLDEDLIGSTPLEGISVPPGRYMFRVEHDDFHEWAQQIDIEAGITTRIYADAIRRERDIDTSGLSQGDVATIVLIGGGVALTTGVILGIIAQAEEERYHNNVNTPIRGDIRQAALDKALIADISFGLSGALIMTSVVLWLTAEDDGWGEETRDLVRLDLVPSGNGWSFTFGGTF